MVSPETEERFERVRDELPKYLDDSGCAKTGENYDIVLSDHRAGLAPSEIASDRGWHLDAVADVIRLLAPPVAHRSEKGVRDQLATAVSYVLDHHSDRLEFTQARELLIAAEAAHEGRSAALQNYLRDAPWKKRVVEAWEEGGDHALVAFVDDDELDGDVQLRQVVIERVGVWSIHAALRGVGLVLTHGPTGKQTGVTSANASDLIRLAQELTAIDPDWFPGEAFLDDGVKRRLRRAIRQQTEKS